LASGNQRKKKIFVCIPSFSGGGAETVMTLLMQSYADNHTVFCIVAKDEGPMSKNVPNTCKIINLNSKSVRRSVLRIARVIRSEKPDVIFSTLAYFNFIVIIAMLLSGHRPDRVVVREANTPESTLKSLPSACIGKIFYRILYNLTDCVICNAKFIGLRLESLGVCSERIAVIPNPVDVDKVREFAKRNVNLPHFRNSSLPTFVSVGRLTHQKGMDRLIGWISQLDSEVNLLIIGSGSDYQSLIEQVKKEALKDNVIILEYMENPFPYMMSADAVVLGSRWEGLPNVALEALAIGRPVIACNECESLIELKRTYKIPNLTIAESEDDFVHVLNGFVKRLKRKQRKSHNTLPSNLPNAFNRDQVARQYSARLFKN
jgi:glycosyltransferase involved in cell wall biosynthesis